MLDWRKAFSQGKWSICDDQHYLHDAIVIKSIADLKLFLDIVHARECLIRPYMQLKDYPVVDIRSLLPSFESDVLEYQNLPGFSLLVLERNLKPFNEIFQYDMLHSVTELLDVAQGPCCPLENTILSSNTQTMLIRLPRNQHESFRKNFQRLDITALELYPALLPYILEMDRAHVLALDSHGDYQLSGVFASLPSDIDGELKRFGIRIGKFQMGDNDLYERNRLFTMQFLMELYGFPVASERRTSAALFARKLHKMGEKFLIRVLGQSDRVLTTIWNDGTPSRYPKVEKMALVRVDHDQKEILDTLRSRRAFVDEKGRVVLLRIQYHQHAYDPGNVRQDRALSVRTQHIVHPLTGEFLEGFNLARDTSNLLLGLNDIVRGEFHGRTIFKRAELVENTDTEEKRLKFLYSWLSKHQRRFIGYSEEFFAGASKILDAYFADLARRDPLDELGALTQEVMQRYKYIRQARTIRCLEEIRSRHYRGERLNYARMLDEAVALLQEFKFELSVYFDDLAHTTIHHLEAILNDRYLRKNYMDKPETALTKTGLDIRRKYGKLVVLLDEYKAIRKMHKTG
jgi:hypothetical protein